MRIGDREFTRDELYRAGVEWALKRGLIKFPESTPADAGGVRSASPLPPDADCSVVTAGVDVVLGDER